MPHLTSFAASGTGAQSPGLAAWIAFGREIAQTFVTEAGAPYFPGFAVLILAISRHIRARRVERRPRHRRAGSVAQEAARVFAKAIAAVQSYAACHCTSV